jgi:RHS repeat-associated protein
LSDKKYHYYLQDHQGNNRVVVDKDGNVKETNHYYPFGGVFASTGSVQPYKYNSKELDTKKGLNWYDYGARMYDPALGRWHVVDPLAEKYCGVSPYTYCKNNPILRIDIDGKDDYVVNKNGYVFFWKNTKYEDKGDRVYYFDGEHKPKQVSGKPITIMDNELMPGMVESQKPLDGYSTYGQTSNIHDAANLFKFAADNSIVEWKLDVYENENDGPTAIIITDHKEGSVERGNNAKKGRL